jgi:ABC-type multidrug transport system fused ATPase/permease subunit
MLRHAGDTPAGSPSIRISDRRMLAWFYHHLAAYWPRLLLGLVATLGATAAGLATTLVLRDIFDDVIAARDLAPLAKLTRRFLALTLAALGLGATRNIVMHLLGQRFVLNVRMDCFRQLMRLGLDFFSRERAGDIMSRISNDVGAVEDLVVHASVDIINHVARIAGAIGLLFALDWRMALVALAPLPVFVGLLWVFTRHVRPVFGRIRRELGEINARLQERIGGIQVIKAFAREEAETACFEESSRDYYRSSCRSIWMWSTFFPLLSLVTSTGMVVLVWYGARRAAGSGARAMSAGTVVAFLRYMQDFYRPVSALAHVQNTVNRSLAAIARLFELFDQRPSVTDRPEAVDPGKIEGRVELRDVTFRYETGEEVLRNVSVRAEPGEVVALVGRSGAGKTSLVNLIARFYDPAAGQVLVDGRDVRDIRQDALRRQIGMVLQETFLFNATVRENIRYARPDATEEEIVAAARGAHAHDFIQRLPQGYDTMVGERGVRLSGGERQRIAIARAFLADPRILILDEATSMVDSEAEQVIQQALGDLMCGRTTFIIAHRLSTVRNADKIVVLDAGQVVEQDSHARLMARNGLYREMIHRQFRFEEEWGASSAFAPEMLGTRFPPHSQPATG